MSTTALVLSPKIESSVKPPPTKAEVIEALAQIKLKQLTEENAANIAKAEVLKKECEAGILELATQKIKTLLLSADIKLGYIRDDSVKCRKVICKAGVDVDLNDSVLSSELRRKLVEYHQVSGKVKQSYNMPKLHDCRKMVRDSFMQKPNATERIQSMLESPTVSKALVVLLKQLEDAPHNKHALTI